MSNIEGGFWSVVNGNDVESNGVGDGCSAITDGVIEVSDAVEVGIRSEGEFSVGVKGDAAVGGGEARDLKVVDIFDASWGDIGIGNTSEQLGRCDSCWP